MVLVQSQAMDEICMLRRHLVIDEIQEIVIWIRACVFTFNQQWNEEIQSNEKKAELVTIENILACVHWWWQKISHNTFYTYLIAILVALLALKDLHFQY